VTRSIILLKLPAIGKYLAYGLSHESFNTFRILR